MLSDTKTGMLPLPDNGHSLPIGAHEKRKLSWSVLKKLEDSILLSPEYFDLITCMQLGW